MRTKLLALPLSLALALGAAGCGEEDSGDEASGASQGGAVQTLPAEAPAAADRIRDGASQLELDEDFVAALERDGIEVSALGDSTLEDGVLTIPVGAGFVRSDDLAGYVEHRGGIALSTGDRRVELRDFFIDTRTGTVYPRVNGARVAMFDLARDRFGVREQDGAIVAEGFDLSLTGDGASALEHELEKPFAADARVGGLDLRLDRLSAETIEEDLRERSEDLREELRDIEDAITG